MGKKANWKKHPAILAMHTKTELARFVAGLFDAEGGYARLGIARETFHQFIDRVGRQYRENPYHNFHHAVDTVHTVKWLIEQPVLSKSLPDTHRFLLMLSALIHDLGHPGTNNQWEVQTDSSLARRYENNSVLEHNSFDQTMRLVEDPACNFFAGLPPAQVQAWWAIVEELVLATDFALHREFLDGFTEYLSHNPMDFSDPKCLSWVSRALIKCADIANTAKPFAEAKAWGQRVMLEFWSQGVQEKERKLPVGPLNDPEKVKMNAAQAGFIKFAALELFEIVSKIEPEMTLMVENLQTNLAYYEEMAQQDGE